MPPKSIAICGAGIASLCLAYRLSKVYNVVVDVYEARSAISEDGAAVGLGANAQTALSLIDPKLRAALDKAGATVMEPSAKFFIGTGSEAGTHIGDISNEYNPQLVVQRSHLIRELYALLPPEKVHTSRKVVSLEDVHAETQDNPTRVRLVFEDGSDTVADCVIGCDGINSTVRSYVLGSEHPNLNAHYTGGFGAQTIISLDDAVATLGADYCYDRTQKVHVGYGAALLTDFVDNGTSMQLIAGFTAEDGEVVPSLPYGPFPKDEFSARCAAFGRLGEAISSVFCRQRTLYVGFSRYHRDIPVFVKDKVCIAGDAAYAFSPARGAGSGQAIEDALILGRALEHAQENAIGSEHALVAYNAIRHSRRTMVAWMSTQAGRLITGCENGVELNVEKLKGQVYAWNREIYNYDFESACRKARDLTTQAHCHENDLYD